MKTGGRRQGSRADSSKWLNDNVCRMAHDPAATRQRLLDAAFDEFAERGLAGARVDRITGLAGTNKQAVYFHFRSKEGLFDAVLTERCGDLADAVPFDPGDLPAYAAGIFDYLAADPRLMRMTTWQHLERPASTEHQAEVFAPKLAALTSRHAAEPARAEDLMLLTLSMATAWFAAGPALQGGDSPEAAERLAIHRAALISAVEAVTRSLADQNP
jgi:AcrR family transcriptional regulator